MDALHARAAAARTLIADHELDPEIALSFVVWPSPRLAALSPESSRVYSEETRRQALDLVDAGWSQARAGRELGVPRPTIGQWVTTRRAAVAEKGDGRHPPRL